MVLALLSMLASISCAAATNDVSADKAINVSLYDLMTDSNSYDGKVIRVSGFICLNPGDPALLFSYKGCDNLEENLGVRLDVSPDITIRRELFGHNSYGSVVGQYRAAKSGEVMIDSQLGPAVIAVKNIFPQSQPFAWSNDIAGVLSESKQRAKFIEIANNFIQYVREKNYQKLAELYIPSKRPSMDVYISDFKNSQSRPGWLLFNSENSVYTYLEKNRGNKVNIEVYREKEPDTYLDCISFDNTSTPFQPSMSYLLGGGSKFCLTIINDGALSSSDFLDN